MRFHLVDRIEELTPRKSVRAVKATSLAEPYWQGEPPVMPPSLVLESICQAGTWLIMGSTDLAQRAALLQVGDFWTHGMVRPGQRLQLTGTVVTWTDEIAVLEGRAHADGELVLEASDIMCSLMDAETLQDREMSRRLYETLVRA